MQSNLAVLADHFHGSGTYLNLGSQLTSRWYPGPDNLPTVDPPLARQLADAERMLHVSVHDKGTVAGAGLAAQMEPGELCYAVADAHHMTWLPYFGRQHMEHSFLLIAPERTDATWSVIDSYTNDTQWGAAKPGRWSLTHEELSALTRIQLYSIKPQPGPAARPFLHITHAPMDHYFAAFDAEPNRERVLNRLTEDTWLLARSRRLHALHRTDTTADGNTDPEIAAHLRDWDKLVTHTYMSFRRVAQGRPEPKGTVEQFAALLAADRRIFTTPDAIEPPAGSAPARYHGIGDRQETENALKRDIAAEVARALDVDAATLLDTGMDLTTLAGFTSFRMVDLIDRLEARFDIELDSDDLVPENLKSMDGLCRIVHNAAPTP